MKTSRFTKPNFLTGLTIVGLSFLPLLYNGCSGEWKSTKGADEDSLQGMYRTCGSPAVEVPQTDLSTLSKDEYLFMAEDLLGTTANSELKQLVASWTPLPPAHHFDNHSPIVLSSLFAKNRWLAATELAKQLAANWQKDCPLRSISQQALTCLADKLGQWGGRLQRQPLAKEQLDRLKQIFTDTYGRATSLGLDNPYQEGVQATLEAFFLSPQFIFKLNLEPNSNSPGNRALNSFEIASRLSYFLTGSFPDETLWDQAKTTDLNQPGLIVKQAKRLLKKDNFPKRFTQLFASQWLDFRRALDDSSSMGTDKLTKGEMATESKLVFQELLTSDQPISSLLQPGFTWVNKNLADHYKMSGNMNGNSHQRITTDDRGGLLHQAQLLSTSASGDETRPVIRGIWILDRLLCESVPLIPAATQDELEQSEQNLGHLPVRERMAAHRRNITCKGCHAQIDPIGLGMENFDTNGHWRTVYEDQRPVEPWGEFDGGRFQDSRELINVIKNNSRFSDCIKKKVVTFATGQDPYKSNYCTLNQIDNEQPKKPMSLQQVILKTVTTDSFRFVRHPQE